MRRRTLFGLVIVMVLVVASVMLFTACEVEKNNGDKPGSSVENTEQFRIYTMAKESGYTGTYEEWLASIRGADGKDGREIELSVVNDKIVWR